MVIGALLCGSKPHVYKVDVGNPGRGAPGVFSYRGRGFADLAAEFLYIGVTAVFLITGFTVLPRSHKIAGFHNSVKQ